MKTKDWREESSSTGGKNTSIGERVGAREIVFDVRRGKRSAMIAVALSKVNAMVEELT
ncbi:MAG: hypothetical protein QOK23_1156 [Gammaproteobacteria bacterium]|jgi:hypothetical protein|nr:hypothetical protein [Gammaproteobacteria bacterium]MEA3138987.1 hypothetical protein [Gammaproteobacteria bacterium]